MKINRDSLLVKIIFYNNIAIIVTAIAVAFITVFITFENMESRLVETAREKISFLDKAKGNYLSKIREDLYEVSRKDILDNIKLIENYNIATQLLKNELLKKDFHTYYRIGIAIINNDGEILGKAGDKEILDSKKCFKCSGISKGIEEGNYLVEINNKIYSKVIIPYKNNKVNKEYLVAAVPLDLNFIQYIKNYIELGNEDKIFAMIGDKYVNGDFSIENGKKFISSDSINTIKKVKRRRNSKR